MHVRHRNFENVSKCSSSRLAAVGRREITGAAGGGRILLQVLELLEDPLRRHRPPFLLYLPLVQLASKQLLKRALPAQIDHNTN